MAEWKKLDCEIDKKIIKRLVRLGFTSPTPVQENCIPKLLSYKDVIVEAVTGSGKTLAFAVPTLQLMLRRSEPWKQLQIGAVVISPTAELAQQTFKVFTSLLPAITKRLKSEAASESSSQQLGCQFHSWTIELFVGGGQGRSLDEDMQVFEASPPIGCNIMVATPGRFCDLLKSGAFQRAIKSLEVLILDEADRLLDMGFKSQLDRILQSLPKQRRTGLFSATQTESVLDIIRAGLRNPVRITIKEKQVSTDSMQDLRTPGALVKYYMILSSELKFSFLVRFIRKNPTSKILVFFSTVLCVRYFGALLEKFLPDKRKPLLIYGQIRKKRKSVLEKFSTDNNAVLLSTDLASRGIDFADVDWVLLFDPPKFAADYVHRVGRTARTGRVGKALLLLRDSESAYVPFLTSNQKVKLRELSAPNDLVNVGDKCRRLLLTDRFLIELGTRAFTSFIQFYLKQECSRGVLNIKDLDIGLLAEQFFLFQLPLMPELKSCDVTRFQPPADFNIQNIPYKLKSIRKNRLIALEKKKQEKLSRKTKVASWSKQAERREKKKNRAKNKSETNISS